MVLGPASPSLIFLGLRAARIPLLGALLSLAFTFALSACDSSLSRSGASRLVNAELGKTVPLVCYWQGPSELGHERLGGVRGRYRFGDTHFPDEPGSCLRRLKAAGIVSAYEGDEFTLGESAHFVSRSDGPDDSRVSVAFPCGTVRVAKVGNPVTEGDRASAVVTFETIQFRDFVGALREAGARCMGSVFPQDAACEARFLRLGTTWSLLGLEGPGCKGLHPQ